MTDPALLRELVDAMPESVASYDRDGRIVDANPAAERLFGRPLADLRGRVVWEVFPHAVGHPLHQAFVRVAGGAAEESLEHYSPGHDRWYASRVVRVGDHVHVVARDVTDEVRRRRRLEALARVSEVLGDDALDLDAVTAAIVRVLGAVLDARCSLALLSGDRRWLELVATSPADAEVTRIASAVRRFPAGEGHPGEALRSGVAVLADEVSLRSTEEAIGDATLKEVVGKFQPASLIVAPLAVDGEPSGVLMAVRRRGRPALTSDDRSLVEDIAPGVSLYLAHARRRAEEERNARRLRSLLAVTSRLAPATSADEIGRVVVDEAVVALDAAIAGLWRLSAANDELVLVRSHGFTGDYARRFERMPLRPGDPVTEAVLGRAAVFVASRAEYVARFPHFEQAHRPDPAPPISIAALPLLDDGRLVGCLHFVFRDERRLGPDERTYLELLAAHTSEALRRSRLHAELRDASELHAALISASPAAMLLLDAQGNVQSWNPAAERIYGWTADEILGGPLEPAVPVEGRRAYEANLRAVIDGGGISGVEVRRRRKDGTPADLELHAAPVRLSDGRAMCLSMVIDVTERRRADRGRQLVGELAAALGHSLDPEETVARIGGLPLGDYADAIAVHLADADGAVPADEPLAAIAAAAREPRWDRDGDRAVLAVPMILGERLLGALSFVSRERSFDEVDAAIGRELASRAAAALENARLYREARAASVAAEAASRAKDQFLAMLGHELRNPLAPISTALQLMRLRAPGVADRERTVIERQVAHLGRLVDDLLDVSRITRGKIELRRERTPVASFVARAIELASPALEQRRHRLTVEVPEDLAVDGDPTRLAQVVGNLVGNAAKYTDPGGHVEVSAARVGEEVVLIVRDDGIGIAPDVLPRVFEMFVQAPQGSARTEGGLGLGLAIVRSLVELHGGRVTARSAGVGRGTEVTVTLAAAAATAEPRSAPAVAIRASRTGRRILVVDDNEDAAFLLGELLDAHGHEVRTAFDGPSALQIAEEFRPDVAVLDLGLPVMDGYEVGQRLRATRLARRLIAVTGYGQEQDRARSFAAGFSAHLAKPVPIDVLVRMLEDD